MTTNEPPAGQEQPTPPTGGAPSHGSVPPPPAGSYPPPPPGGHPQAPGGYGGAPLLNKKAMWSMITGIVSIVGLCCTFGGLLGIVAIVLGVISRGEIAKSDGTQTGGGMSVAGIVTGAVGILGFVVILVLVITGVVDTSYNANIN